MIYTPNNPEEGRPSEKIPPEGRLPYFYPEGEQVFDLRKVPPPPPPPPPFMEYGPEEGLYITTDQLNKLITIAVVLIITCIGTGMFLIVILQSLFTSS
jgi:hypothetical protein